jgi:hypothetical protein
MPGIVDDAAVTELFDLAGIAQGPLAAGMRHGKDRRHAGDETAREISLGKVLQRFFGILRLREEGPGGIIGRSRPATREAYSFFISCSRYQTRSSFFMILPVAVRGNSSVKMNRRGIL